MVIVTAETPVQFQQAAGLFQEYAAGLGFDLAFQGFDAELENLPVMYGPPDGCLLLVMSPGGEAVGCVGLRRLADGACEMKRLYVKPDIHGQGLGRRLAEAVIAEARALGYAAVRLDTVAEMAAANALYLSLGFRPIPAYRYNPLETAAYYELPL
ncbi:MAG: GNAT family N-acetyltransferase [Pseudomonadota bacterium]